MSDRKCEGCGQTTPEHTYKIYGLLHATPCPAAASSPVEPPFLCPDCGDSVAPELLTSRANQTPDGKTLCEPCRKDRMLADAMDRGVFGDVEDYPEGLTADDLFGGSNANDR